MQVPPCSCVNDVTSNITRKQTPQKLISLKALSKIHKTLHENYPHFYAFDVT